VSDNLTSSDTDVEKIERLNDINIRFMYSNILVNP